MPCINLPIDSLGPVIEIGISSPRSLGGSSGPLPKIHWIKAIADTGCTTTSIHSSVAARCGLQTISKVPASNPGGVIAVNIYHADVFLRPLIGGKPFEWLIPDRGILEMVNPNPNFEALLGMDVLGMGVFTTNGLTKQATFCW
jgi:hypothetical protein